MYCLTLLHVFQFSLNTFFRFSIHSEKNVSVGAHLNGLLVDTKQTFRRLSVLSQLNLSIFPLCDQHPSILLMHSGKALPGKNRLYLQKLLLFLLRDHNSQRSLYKRTNTFFYYNLGKEETKSYLSIMKATNKMKYIST